MFVGGLVFLVVGSWRGCPRIGVFGLSRVVGLRGWCFRRCLRVRVVGRRRRQFLVGVCFVRFFSHVRLVFLGAGPRPAIVLPPVGVNNIVCVFDYNVLYSWCSCARGGLWSWTVFSPGPFLYLWGLMWGALVVCWVPVFMPFLGPVAGRKSPQKVRTRSYSHGLNDNNRNSDIALTSANNKTAG